MLGSVKDVLMGDQHGGRVAERFAAAGISPIAGMRSARYDDSNSVSGPKAIGGGPKFYFHLARGGAIWPQPPVAVADVGGAAFPRHVAQA